MSRTNAAVALLADNLELHPDKIAYFCGERVLSFRELADASFRFASYLSEQGVAPGDRVLIALPDCFAFPTVFLGCLLCGAMAVAAAFDQREEDFRHIIEDSRPRLLVTQVGLEDSLPITGKRIKAVVCDDDGPLEKNTDSACSLHPHQPADGDVAYMLYSSGSTGRPKGVPHRHKSLLLPCDLAGKEIFGITGDDIIFSTSKLSFSYGLINSLAFPLRFGATAVLHPGKPDAPSILREIGRRCPSVFFSVPTLYSQIIIYCSECGLKLPMRLCCSAGEALPVAVYEEWRRLTGMEIVDGIGCTEMSYHFISNIPGRTVPGSAGRLVQGYLARLVDDGNSDVSSGREGHLLIKGDTMSPFYWNLPDRGPDTVQPDCFFRTGDILYEKDGFYYFRGRSDDMIKSDARWVSPLPVEEVLRSHPDVSDCAVAAVTVGAFCKPGAFLVLKPGVRQTPELVEELKTILTRRLPDYMRPVRFRFLDALPRTPTGKVRRCGLAEII